MLDLLPCPFCGSEAVLRDDRTLWAVDCTNSECRAIVLGIRAPEPTKDMSDKYWEGIRQTAIDRWNKRI